LPDRKVSWVYVFRYVSYDTQYLLLVTVHVPMMNGYTLAIFDVHVNPQDKKQHLFAASLDGEVELTVQSALQKEPENHFQSRPLNVPDNKKRVIVENVVKKEENIQLKYAAKFN